MRLLTRSLNARSGEAAKGTASAFSTSKLRSGIRFLSDRGGSLLQPVKEDGNLLPNFGAAGQAAPVRANQSHKLVALINGHEIILSAGVTARAAHTIDQQRFNIRLHLFE